MKTRCASLLTVVLMTLSVGCAEKKQAMKHSHLPLKYGVRVRFEGIKDNKCEIGDVLLDAKTGGYVVVCK